MNDRNRTTEGKKTMQLMFAVRSEIGESAASSPAVCERKRRAPRGRGECAAGGIRDGDKNGRDTDSMYLSRCEPGCVGEYSVNAYGIYAVSYDAGTSREWYVDRGGAVKTSVCGGHGRRRCTVVKSVQPAMLAYCG